MCLQGASAKVWQQPEATVKLPPAPRPPPPTGWQIARRAAGVPLLLAVLPFLAVCVALTALAGWVMGKPPPPLGR